LLWHEDDDEGVAELYLKYNEKAQSQLAPTLVVYDSVSCVSRVRYMHALRGLDTEDYALYVYSSYLAVYMHGGRRTRIIPSKSLDY